MGQEECMHDLCNHERHWEIQSSGHDTANAVMISSLSSIGHAQLTVNSQL